MGLDLTTGWHLPGIDKTFDISKLRNDDKVIQKYYIEFFIKKDGLKKMI